MKFCKYSLYEVKDVRDLKDEEDENPTNMSTDNWWMILFNLWNSLYFPQWNTMILIPLISLV